MIPKGLEEAAVVAAMDDWNAEAVVAGTREHDELTLVIAADRIRETCRFLKDRQQFVRLSSVTAVDWHPREPRFEVIYHLHSIERNERLRLKCRLDGDSPEIDSVTPVWSGADWYEREVYDLFGVRFRGHPNLKRLLLPEEWEGHPLRKDFPVHGFKYSYGEEAE